MKAPTVHRAGKPRSSAIGWPISTHIMTALHQRPVLPPSQGRTGLGELHSRQLSGMTFKAKGTKSSKEASRITALMSG